MNSDNFELSDFKIENGILKCDFDRFLYLATRITRCLCIENLYKEYPDHDKSMVIQYAIAKSYDHDCKNPIPDQPERSKREDLECQKCDKERHQILMSACCDNCLSDYLDYSKMRCSEHGG